MANRSPISELMLPQVWLRQQWLRRALRDYPIYDPPHRVEEYLLSQAEAQENFDYFMRTREQRMDFFMAWLRRHFRVTVTLDEKGVRALNRWGNRYAGLLQQEDSAGNPIRSYFSYEPAWMHENLGCNVLFDMGTTFGEILIANLPKLYWALEPTAELLPRRSRKLKKSAGMSFQRPKLTGWDDPLSEGSVHHLVWLFAASTMDRMTTLHGWLRYRRMGWIDREHVRDQLINAFASLLDEPSPAIDEIARMRTEMPLDEYARMIDEEADRNLGDD